MTTAMIKEGRQKEVIRRDRQALDRKGTVNNFFVNRKTTLTKVRRECNLVVKTRVIRY